MRLTGLVVAMGVMPMMCSGQAEPDALNPNLDPGFRPVLVAAQFTSRRVRPGDRVGVTLTFRNEGAEPAEVDHRVFVHFEYPDASCSNIVFAYDHQPTVPTTLWLPGEDVVDGPHLVPVPEDAVEARYHVHVGVFAPTRGGGRLLDTRAAGEIQLDRQAPPLGESGPAPLTQDVLRNRRDRRAAIFRGEAASIERPEFVFQVLLRDGRFALTDRRTGVMWTSDPRRGAPGHFQVERDGVVRTLPLWPFDRVEANGTGLALVRRVPIPGTAAAAVLNITATPVDAPAGVRFRWRGDCEDGWRIRSVRLFDGAFGVTDSEDGAVLVPFRLGELHQAQDAIPNTRTYMTYNNLTMAMWGAVKDGSALLVSWPHADTGLEVASSWPDHPAVPGRRLMTMSLDLHGDSRECTVCPLGAGDYGAIAKAYRTVARERGWLRTWREKREARPRTEAMYGAADFKPFVLSRTLAGTRFNDTDRDRVHLGYTFAEAARIAEHLHRDVGIDRAMFVLAGWIHRGYDNQHPDILPACPECGGNEGLADCARRVRDCGFLFGLHDNYQDMYEDAPSWNEAHLNKSADGTPKKGGRWAGGQAWQVCAIEQVALAQRQQNLPAVARLFGPTIYFIDTVFAWPLVTCADPEHPMTRTDDMRWKSRLCDVAREHFGLFGSEEGREWAVPHADYMEGLLSHKISAGRNDRGYSRSQGGRIVPLFEMVYGDCINLYTHQSDRAVPLRPSYILDCILYAENALYGFGPHLYYEEAAPAVVPIRGRVAAFESLGKRRFRVVYEWRAEDTVATDYARVFVHFVHPGGDARREGIAFQDDHLLDLGAPGWSAGRQLTIGPRDVEIPEGIEGRVKWYVGLVDPNGGRARLPGTARTRERLLLGELIVDDGTVRFEPAAPESEGLVFARADGGWAADLCATDRLIKNTYEVLSPLNRITAETPMTDHAFVTADGSVERSAFAETHIWVNYGSTPFEIEPRRHDLERLAPGRVVLPRNGFLVLSPRFVAFHAAAFGGRDYATPALFTVASLDDSPLWESARARVFHGFGDAHLRICGTALEVAAERVVRLAD